MSKGKRLDSILEFLQVSDRLKSVYRAGYLSDLSRHESSAEHVWHTCILALLLHEEAGLDLNVAHFIELLLVHDLVEVYAGDAALHDEEARKTKAAREADAAEKVFAILPPDLGERFKGWWREFEEAKTPESRFAQEVDRIQAIAQNLFAGGKTWADYQVTEELARERNLRAMRFDPSLGEIFEALYERAGREGLWFGEGD